MYYCGPFQWLARLKQLHMRRFEVQTPRTILLFKILVLLLMLSQNAKETEFFSIFTARVYCYTIT